MRHRCAVSTERSGASVTAMTVETEVVRNNVVATLSDASRHAQMVVVGCRGLGAVRRLLLGSANAGLLRHAHCPVTVVHHHDGELSVPSPAAPVLVGIDGSPSAEKAIAFAFDEASRRRTDLVALHAWSDVGVFPAVMDWRTVESEAHEVLAERLAGWQERYPDVRVERRIVCDKPASWLIEGSEHVQLVVVGSHGRGGIPEMRLGSVATAVAELSNAPVVVRADGN